MRTTARYLSPVLFVCLPYIGANKALADSSHGHSGLHFSHPLISESPSPDSKIRLDYFYFDIEDGEETAEEHTANLELEHAFHRTFSIELDIPYTFLEPERGSSENRIGNIGIGLKFANFAFEGHNLLLGYGIEFGLPTGDEDDGIGSDHIFEIEPFLSLGYKLQRLEFVSFVSFGIPTNQQDGEGVETELGFNASFLYHATPKVELLLEFDGESVLSGEEDGVTVANISPGIKISPVTGSTLQFGVGAGFPITNNEEFDTRLIASIFYHF